MHIAVWLLAITAVIQFFLSPADTSMSDPVEYLKAALSKVCIFIIITCIYVDLCVCAKKAHWHTALLSFYCVLNITTYTQR